MTPVMRGARTSGTREETRGGTQSECAVPVREFPARGHHRELVGLPSLKGGLDTSATDAPVLRLALARTDSPRTVTCWEGDAP